MSIVQESVGEVHNVTIVLDRNAYFPASDGSVVELSAAAHRVEFGDDGHLRLSSLDPSDTRVRSLQTFNIWHELNLISPLALSVPVDEDTQHIVMLLPGGAALQSTGSLRRTAGRRAGAQTFVTTTDLARAILNWRPVEIPIGHPFNAAAVLKDVSGLLLATIEPGPSPSAFQPNTVPPNWINTQVYTCLPGPTATPLKRGSFIDRALLSDYMESVTPVVVTSLPFSLAGRKVELFVTAQVIQPPNDPMMSMTWRDWYHIVPTAHGPVTFPGVIVANARVYTSGHTPPAGKTWGDVAADMLTSPSGMGAPTDFELFVDGISVAAMRCGYIGHGTPGGPPALKC